MNHGNGEAVLPINLTLTVMVMSCPLWLWLGSGGLGPFAFTFLRALLDVVRTNASRAREPPITNHEEARNVLQPLPMT